MQQIKNVSLKVFKALSLLRAVRLAKRREQRGKT
jgi:hypothetical protein